jgi:heterogeneous nuclear ribonucleoprotein A1/A3
MDFKKRKVEDNNGSTVVAEITKEDVKKLIEPFNKEQLMEILQDAATRHNDVLEEIRKLADKDPAHRKIFVRGLGWDTTSDTVKSIFSTFGELEEGAVIIDKSTGKSRGFGFVTFRHMDGAQRALKEPSKRIDGRMTVCQLAATGALPQAPVQEVATRKIYVGNVHPELTADKLLALFAQFGEIEEGPLGFDKHTGRSRGFALIIYKSAESAKRSLQEPIKSIAGHQMHCKLAVEGQKLRTGASGGQSGKLEGGEANKNALQMSNTQSALGLVGGAGGNLQYHSSHGLLSSGLAMNQGLGPAVNQGLGQLNGGLNQALQSSLAGQNQNLTGYGLHSHHALGQSLNSGFGHSSNSTVNNSYSQGLNQGLLQGVGQGLQAQTSLGLGSYGGNHVGITAYGTQPSLHSGQPSAYSNMGGMSIYGATNSNVNQAGVLQNGAAGGHYQFSPYSNSQLAASSASRAQTVGNFTHLPSPYYNL